MGTKENKNKTHNVVQQIRDLKVCVPLSTTLNMVGGNLYFKKLHKFKS